MRHLTKVKELNLSDNKFTGLPAEVGQLSELRVLDLSNNSFTGLPQELGNLQRLEKLNLSGNDVSELDLKIISERLPASTIIITEFEAEEMEELENDEDELSPVACTADAKMCPDGSSVGRVGPNCEFEACPM